MEPAPASASTSTSTSTSARALEREEFRENGCVRLAGLLDHEALADCRRCFEFAVAHPSPIGGQHYKGQGGGFYEDSAGTKDSLPVFTELVNGGTAGAAIAHACLDLWGDSKNVWYYDHEVFWKFGGRGRGTPFHQDTGVIPFKGEHMAVIWISFGAVPKENAVEVVRGSHRGPLYNEPQAFSLVPDIPRDVPGMPDTRPLYTLDDHRAVGLEEVLPTLPDVVRDRESLDLVSFATAPGDVLVFHPHCLHGGAPVDANFPERHTLVLRFFGDDCFYRTLPKVSEFKMYREYVREGDHFSKSKGFGKNGSWIRVRGPGLEDLGEGAGEEATASSRPRL